MTGQPEREWEFYTTASGTPIVRQEIHKELQGKPPLRELGQLMWRIQQGTTLPRDTKHLGDGLLEARLTYQSNEYRLYYAQGVKGEHVLLALKFHHKRGQASQDRAIEIARERLSDWRSRI